MPAALRILVRFHDGRYHGAGDWPPAPARLFQALVAAAAVGGVLPNAEREALEWLERLEPPVIRAPAARAGCRLVTYVPNNNLDAVGGEIRRLGEIREAKRTRPWFFDPEGALVYQWTLPDRQEDRCHAEVCKALADRLYQLGRGVDMAWAWGEILDGDGDGLAPQPHGVVYRPLGPGPGARPLSCPRGGSFASLKARFDVGRARFGREGKTVVLRQPPPPQFAARPYEALARRLLFELRDSADDAVFAPQRGDRSIALTQAARDCAIEKLKAARPDRADAIEAALRGRGAGEADKARRVQIIPLPSIGHAHADRAIRRLLVMVPGACGLPAADVAWAFSGLAPDNGRGWRLLAADSRDFLRHYGLEPAEPARLWRTVTPVALPWPHERARLLWESAAGHAVRQALRHAGFETPALAVRVQREPFQTADIPASAFAANRFGAARLWHTEIEFREPVRGPVVVGDGRYLGLGLMAPVPDAKPGFREFVLGAAQAISPDHCPDVTRAVRRALMSLARGESGQISRLFSGHEPDGAPAASGNHDHVFLAAYASRPGGALDRMLVAAPWACDPAARVGREDPAAFDRVVGQLRIVRAGRLGLLRMELLPASAPGPALGPALEWTTATPYGPTRHLRRRDDPAAAVARDVLLECHRRGLPEPRVRVEALAAAPNGGGVQAQVRLHFAAAVRGPILLGRYSHQGGGLFLPGRGSPG